MSPLFKKKSSAPMSPAKKPAPSLAIAINMKKPKKLARGGEVETAKSIDAENKHEDSAEEARNSGDKALKDPTWTDPTWSKYGKGFSIKQGLKPSPLPIGDHKVNDRELTQKENEGLLDLTSASPEKKLPAPMADGGQVGLDEAAPHTGESEAGMLRRHADELIAAGYDKKRPAEDEYMAGHFAEGGEVDGDLAPGEEDDNSPGRDIFASIKSKQMADGGMVDLNEHSEEHENTEDDLSYDALKKELYDDSQLDEQPLDSNQHGDEEETLQENDDDSSIVSKIRRKYKK